MTQYLIQSKTQHLVLVHTLKVTYVIDFYRIDLNLSMDIHVRTG